MLEKLFTQLKQLLEKSEKLIENMVWYDEALQDGAVADETVSCFVKTRNFVWYHFTGSRIL